MSKSRMGQMSPVAPSCIIFRAINRLLEMSRCFVQASSKFDGPWLPRQRARAAVQAACHLSEYIRRRRRRRRRLRWTKSDASRAARAMLADDGRQLYVNRASQRAATAVTIVLSQAPATGRRLQGSARATRPINCCRCLATDRSCSLRTSSPETM